MPPSSALPQLIRGTVLFHKTSRLANNQPLTVTVTGATQTLPEKEWKHRCSRVKIPVRQGFRNNFYLYETDFANWTTKPNQP